ncbi:hypothetical protein ACTFIZ_001922 [Dictyostelium cf. discoideum]
MKIIISLIIIFVAIISISNAIKIENKGEAILKKSDDTSFINFTPYDENCKGSTKGIGFGSVGGYYCLQNETVDLGATLNMHFMNDDQHVNLTSSNDNYCSEPDFTQIFKLNQCDYYKYSNTNYYVSTSAQPQIPKNSFVIVTKDDLCESIYGYWFVSSGITINDYFYNQTNTYTCEGGIPYITTCNVNGSGDSSSNCVKLKTAQSCFIYSHSEDVYCT